jgi:hypothetical protein
VYPSVDRGTVHVNVSREYLHVLQLSIALERQIALVNITGLMQLENI